MLKRALTFLTLFTSMSTLICCALPALFVALGMGAVFAGLVSTFPGLVFLSEYKVALFILGGALLVVGGYAQWHAKTLPCPIDKTQAEACTRSRRISKVIYGISVAIYAIGAGFAFIAPLFL